MASRILVIEDNPTNLDLVTYLLKASGYEVYPAMTGAEGVRLALAEQPDLVLCDIHLPDFSGLEVVAALKREDAMKSTPFIAVTALAMVGDRERILSGGFDGYIAKPLEPEAFLLTMRSFMSGAA